MTDEDLIAQHIATKGVTICPPWGWARDLPIIPESKGPGFKVWTEFRSKKAKNKHDFSNPNKAQINGAKKASEGRSERAIARRKQMVADYLKAPGIGALIDMADQHKISASRVREILREEGVAGLPLAKDVSRYDFATGKRGV